MRGRAALLAATAMAAAAWFAVVGPACAAAAPQQVRVLLRRTSEPIELPLPGRRYLVSAKGGSSRVAGPLTISLARSTGRIWQVGAWREAETATRASEQLTAKLAGRAEVIQEPTAGDLVRIRVAWRGEPPADAGALLAGLGFPGALPVVPGEAIRIASAETPVLELAGEVELQPLGDWPTAIGARWYRGVLRVRASGSRLLLINILDLESYLRGVVPVEMGPAVFPELEALKAQAVAARTYTVAHLGDHDDEGYDLCDSAACQAYNGSGVEHPLSDRAVTETAGLIAVFQGVPIDAMYTSTCGGHTETAAFVFPDREQPYLQGVRCAWERPLVLLGDRSDGPWQQRSAVLEELARRALDLPDAAAAPRTVLTAVARHCAGTLPILQDTSAEAYAAALLQAGGLGQAGLLVAGPTGLDRLLQLGDLHAAELSPPPASWSDGWHLRAALAVLQLQGVVVRDSGEAVPRPEGVGIYPRNAERSAPLPSPLPLLESWQGSLRRAGRLELLPGTRLERWQRAKEVLALMVERSGGDGEADRRSAWRGWVRELPWTEVGRRLGMPDLQELQVSQRSPTGRIIALVVSGRSGARRAWSGYEVKRALDLPETLFSLHRLPRPAGADVVRFLGRGWGHGIGLCQNGAYGMARSGRDFEQILTTYYTGIEVVSWLGAVSK